MRDLLPLFPKPSHYAGMEHGAVRKDPADVDARLALAFPDLYEVGTSNTGLAILYSTINARKEFWAERVFAPSLEAAKVLKEHGSPLCTLESDTPLSQLDAVGFHLGHELCYTNILYMLDLAGIPLKAEERLHSWPLILAGGGCAFNAEPLAPFMDLMVLGDGEGILVRLMEELAASKQLGIGKEEFLFRCKDIPGVYIPAFFPCDAHGMPNPSYPESASVEKSVLPDLDQGIFPTSPPMAIGSVHDRYTLEIARGCTRGCRFCHAGMVYRPVRERSLKSLDILLKKGLAETGFDEVSFLSLSAGDFSALAGLFSQCLQRCQRDQVSISLPSLRVGSVDAAIMNAIAGIRRTGVTIAPEAGSQRLRNVINKEVSEEGLLKHTAMLFENGWHAVKLYFMIGLPTETFEDLDAILDLCLKVKKTAGPKPRRLQITAAVSPFVPKPHTPFQWERQIGLEEIRERINYLKTIFSKHKHLKLRWHIPEMSYLEGVFSRAGRDLAPVVESAYAKGALFASWNDHFSLEPWLEALREHGLNPDDCLAERDMDAPLPWDHLNTGVKKSYLKKERKRAYQEALTPDCRFGPCQNCGVCNMGGRASELAAQHPDIHIRPVCNNRERDQEPHAPLPSAPKVSQEVAANAPPGASAQTVEGDLGHKAAHFRFWYAKQDDAVWLSQLELQSLLDRALRRASVPLAFTRGFHPMPLLSFARALPVGVSSQEEYFDLFLRQEREPRNLFDSLAPEMPPGLDLLRVLELGMGKKQPQSVAEVFSLRYLVPPEQHQGLLESWKEFLDSDSRMWTRMTRKGPRTRDIRPFFKAVDSGDPNDLRIFFDWSDGYMSPLNLVLAVTPEASLEQVGLLKLRQYFTLPEEPKKALAG